MISSCCLMEFIRHAHLILECNSSLILICFLIICNIISQKPPFFNSFSQKKVQLLRVGIRFLCPSNFYSLKIKLYQDFQKVRRKLSVVQMAGIEPARFIGPQDFKERLPESPCLRFAYDCLNFFKSFNFLCSSFD